jgi:hypothetical protein
MSKTTGTKFSFIKLFIQLIKKEREKENRLGKTASFSKIKTCE